MDLTPQQREVLEAWQRETAEARERAFQKLFHITGFRTEANALLDAYADEESH